MTGIVGFLVDAIVGGAAAVAKGIATDAVKAAYGAVKDRVGARLSMWRQIEEKPDSPAYRQVIEEELGQHTLALASDIDMMEQLKVLQGALARLDAGQAQAAGIDIARIRAGRDAFIGGLTADGLISVREVVANQDVRIGDIQAGTITKKY